MRWVSSNAVRVAAATAVAALTGACTTTGMLIADAVGIGVGIVLGKRIPERLIKWVAALIFMFFGLSGLQELLPGEYFYPILILSALGLLGFLVYDAVWGRKKRGALQALACEPGEERLKVAPAGRRPPAGFKER